MSEQIDQLGKLKARMEKDRMTVKMQLDDTKSAIEHVSHDKAGKLGNPGRAMRSLRWPGDGMAQILNSVTGFLKI